MFSFLRSRKLDTKLKYASPSFAEGAARVIDMGSTMDRGRGYRVRYRAVNWNARLLNPDMRALQGDSVTVIGREGLTLIVKPLEK